MYYKLVNVIRLHAAMRAWVYMCLVAIQQCNVVQTQIESAEVHAHLYNYKTAKKN